MKLKALLAGLTTLLAATVADAQQQGNQSYGPGAIPANATNPSNGGANTFTGKNTFSGSKFSLSIDPTIATQFAGLQEKITVDPTPLGSVAQWTFFSTTLALTNGDSSTTIWENLKDDLVTTLASGTATLGHEINILHPSLENVAGVTITTSEVLEVSNDNFGVLTSHVGFLSLMHNDTTGTVTNSIYGVKFNFENDNTTAGSVAQYFAIDMEPQTGSGSAPTSYGFIRESDSAAPSFFAGNVEIGSLASNPSTALKVVGPDTSGGTFPFIVVNSGASNIFYVRDDRVVVVPNVLNVQTGYQANGTSGVNCAANSVSLATEVVSAGIVTHC